MKYAIPDTWISPEIKIKKSPLGGKGMFTTSLINKGENVFVSGGVWEKDYTDKKGSIKAGKKGKLVMQWDEDLFSVEERGSDPTYFINHSCNPNVWMVDAFALTARKTINEGEEIVADYALWETDENYVSGWVCNCDSSLCRKRITGKDWKLKELQERYKDHFSPLINKRITKTNK